MSIKEINIKDKKETLEIHVTLNERDDYKGCAKMRFDTSDVLKLLNDKKVAHGKCIQEQTLKNWSPQLLSGVWIFKKLAVTKTKPRQRRTTTKKTTTEE